MRKTLIFKTAAALLTTNLLFGCSSMDPVPAGQGNSLVYQSGDRPEWTGKTFYTDGQFAYAIGISNRMPTEKSARESAVTNAMANLASSIRSEGIKQNTETQNINNADSEAVNKTVNSANYSSSLQSHETLLKPSVDSSYFEIWGNSRNGTQFFKQYVLVKTRI